MGKLKGEGMALAGLIMGWISVAMLPVVLILAVIAIPNLLRSRQVANEAAAVDSLRRINAAEITYRSSAGGYGNLSELVDSDLVDDSFERARNGYLFSVELDETDYTATATPATVNTGRWAFSTTSDGVIRYSLTPALAPPGREGLPVQ